MNIRDEIQPWILDALASHGGKATITEVARYIWQNHEGELRSSDYVFFNWQYEMRWAAGELRRKRKMEAANSSRKGIWELREQIA